MKVTEQVSRLRLLLDRVRRNAQRPRLGRALGLSGSEAPESPRPASRPLAPAAELQRSEPPPLAAVPAPPAIPSPVPTAEQFTARAAVSDSPLVEIDDEELIDDGQAQAEEEVPASSQRSRIAAAAHSEARIADEPIKTPPPESGPQSATPARGPRPEQLGQTLELEEPLGPPLEVAESIPAESKSKSGELEISLPRHKSVGIYSANLEPPPEAALELENYGWRAPAQVVPESDAPLPPSGQGPTERLARPSIVTGPVAEYRGAVGRSRESFLELLDKSLSLSLD